MTTQSTKYCYDSPGETCAHSYLLPAIDRVIDRLPPPTRIFDFGCGNGSVANHLSRRCAVSGIDYSDSAVRIANENYPHVRIEQRSVYDDLAARFGQFPIVVSLEVVEHLFDPRPYARNMFNLLEPGGAAIVSTPYHGYVKNVALAVSGKLDGHFTALWDGGHIKFWSFKTLGHLLREAGFKDIRFERVGRVPLLAKSMIAVARRPGAEQS